ncbi:hypothetical protein RSOL_092090, partial [Rhizoctonia solani AG-3 Rhs1AP]
MGYQNLWAAGYHFYGPPPPLAVPHVPAHYGIPPAYPIPPPPGAYVPNGILAAPNNHSERNPHPQPINNALTRPNLVVGRGVIAIPFRLHKPNDEIQLFSIKSDLLWDDFIVVTSGYLGSRTCETHLTVRHTKMRAADRVRITDNTEWQQFMHQLTTCANTARSRAIEIDIYLVREVGEMEREEVAPLGRGRGAGGKQGKKRGRSEDIPEGSEDNRLTAHWYALLKSKHACEYHSRAGAPAWCYVRDPALGAIMHRRLSLELIGLWSNQCSIGEATEHHPPNILALDTPRKKAKSSSSKRTQEINLNITHSIASPNLPVASTSSSDPSRLSLGPTQSHIALHSNMVTGNESTTASTNTTEPLLAVEYPLISLALELVNPNYELELWHCICALENKGYYRVNQVEEAGLAKLIDEVGVDEEYAPEIVDYCSLLAEQAREEAYYSNKF